MSLALNVHDVVCELGNASSDLLINQCKVKIKHLKLKHSEIETDLKISKAVLDSIDVREFVPLCGEFYHSSMPDSNTIASWNNNLNEYVDMKLNEIEREINTAVENRIAKEQELCSAERILTNNICSSECMTLCCSSNVSDEECMELGTCKLDEIILQKQRITEDLQKYISESKNNEYYSRKYSEKLEELTIIMQSKCKKLVKSNVNAEESLLNLSETKKNLEENLTFLNTSLKQLSTQSYPIY